MWRLIEIELEKWKQNRVRLPLLLRGARQVGKSYVVESFAQKNFKNNVTINFELEPECRQCFNSLDPKKIIRNLQLVTGKTIDPQKTLLFLDEIQDCPEAILALRYFKEKLPQMAVIGAGSLLEFTLQESQFSFPVGRVQFLYLKPLSFSEFLLAQGESKLYDYFSEISIAEPINESVHERCLLIVRNYMAVGGMPAVTATFCQGANWNNCQNLQSSLLQAYYSDFGKYAGKSDYKYLKRVFERLPHLVAQHFKYSTLDSELRSRDIKEALSKLIQAGLVTRVHASSASGFPLSAEMKEGKFKPIYLDIGLLLRALQVPLTEILNSKDITLVNAGVLAEQFVAQELMAYNNSYEPADLFFWEREKKGSSAEVDYVISHKGCNIPIEVKAGKTGRLRSLQQFLTEKGSPCGVRISQHTLDWQPPVLSIPFYLIQQLPRLLDEVLSLA